MNFKKLIIIFLLLLIIFGISARFFSASKDFTADETDFVKPAEAIKNTGEPIFYHSEQQPRETALWHPPMYIYLMSLALGIENSEIAARSINIIFSLLISLLIFLFCYKLFKNGKLIGLLAGALFLVNYYILSSSIQIDIDILSAFFVFSFIFSVIMSYKSKKNIYFLLAVTSLFFSLWNRYPIAVLVYVSLLFYCLANKDLRKDFKKYALIGILAVAGFILVWGIYSLFIEPGNFFSFLVHNAKFGAEQVSNLIVYAGSFVLNITQFIRLVSFPAVILMIMAFFYFFKNKEASIRILIISSLAILIFFFALPRPAFGYPRYFLSAFPAVFVLISLYLFEKLENIKLDKKILIIAILSFLISLDLLVILKPQLTIYDGKGLIKATNLPDFLFNLLASLPLALLFLIKKARKKVAVVILLALVLSYSLYFDIGLIKHKAYIKDAGIYIKERTVEDDIVITPKSVGYYTERRFYFNDNNRPKTNFSYAFLKEYIKKSFDNRKMSDEFFWQNGYFSGLNIILDEETLEKVKYIVLYHPVQGKGYEKKIGDFYIYKVR